MVIRIMLFMKRLFLCEVIGCGQQLPHRMGVASLFQRTMIYLHEWSLAILMGVILSRVAFLRRFHKQLEKLCEGSERRGGVGIARGISVSSERSNRILRFMRRGGGPKDSQVGRRVQPSCLILRGGEYAMKTSEIKKYRVQLDFQKDAFEELEALQKAMGASSRAEVFRHSLRLMQWVIEQIDAGNNVLLRTPDGFQEVVLPFLRKQKTGGPAAPSKQEKGAAGLQSALA